VEAALVHPLALQPQVLRLCFLQLHPMVAALDLKIARPAPQTALAAVAVIQTALVKTALLGRATEAVMQADKLLAVVVVAHLLWVQMRLAAMTPAMAATALRLQFLEAL
jgi:hypothetical protein